MRLLRKAAPRSEVSYELRGTFRVQTNPRGTPRRPGSPLFLVILRDIVLGGIIETSVTLNFFKCRESFS